ncbi:DUF3857 domain-containing protein [Flavobacterium xinjiangense]|jgi:transglutaminase-like putative cysteine protease|uniref:Transglutaminase-like superfamily protein n=1 Tax=Flavobacterium xinjiangense TaxID=178356 RepID=A0A1M7G1T0_9FLAO|nr:DUF3857 domain-containing protein [Flavobacterium xinjiangense]SHM10241.1 Transglutaminase-like superfamily protein [Flavobacterium xinjiangense]
MKCNQLAIILFFTLFFLKANAQEFKLGKVSIEELQEKVNPKDTSAVAAILFKKGETRCEYSNGVGFTVITKVALRIKIYKKEGYDWANQQVNFVKVSFFKETVDFTDAITYNLVGGKIEKTKLKGEGEFEENIDKFLSKKKITMPNVKVGSVIEYEYTIKSPNVGSFKDFDFQTNIPVNYVEYTTYIPDYFSFTNRFKGFITPRVISDKKNREIVMVDKEIIVGQGTKFSERKIFYQETKTSYIVENLPALKDEVYVNNVNNYAVSLSQELSTTKFPDEPLKMISADWNSVVKSIYEFDNFGPELNKTGYFEEDMKNVIAGLSTPEEKITALLNYVKTTVKWNDYYGYSCNDGVKKAYKEKTGNIAEINLMLTAMLRYSGLTANPVLVSTRSNGIAIFPNRTAFNYVIAAVETPNGLILLDASDKFSMPNILPFRALNWMGRLIRKDGTSEEVDLMPKVVSNNTVMMNYSVDVNGQIAGKLRRQRTNHNAMIYRINTDNIKEETYLEKLENENEKIEIKDYSRANEKELNLPVSETFSFSGANLCEGIGGKIYINPLLFFSQQQNPFKQENREYPIDYGFPFLDKYSINIQIPEGYKVETLPSPAVLNMQDNLGSFKFMTNLSENTIQLVITNQINTAIISSEYYSMLKEYYQGMVAKENEKIVLTKI